MSRFLLLLLVLGCAMTFFFGLGSGAAVGGDDVTDGTKTRAAVAADPPATAPGTAEKKHVLVQAFDTNGDGRLDEAERGKINSKEWLEFHRSMKVKAMGAIRDAIPTLTEMKKRLQQARLEGGDIPKELFNKQKLHEKVSEQKRAGTQNARDTYPEITVAPGSTDLHKRSLEHAQRYHERKQLEKKAQQQRL